MNGALCRHPASLRGVTLLGGASSRRPVAAVRSLIKANATSSSKLPRLQPFDDTYEEWHKFSTYSNWLVPGAVMVGRYPFVEPSQCHSRDQGEQQLSDILGAGISTFVCLQSELPPQDQLKLSGKDGYLPYKSTAQLIQAALNGPPEELESIHALRTPDLDKFLPPKKQKPNEASHHSRKELQFLHSPIVDTGLPSKEALAPLMADLQRRLEAGEKLYIHCAGGRGRSGTVGACLLQAAYGIGVEESLERVQRSFGTRGGPQGSKSPETDAQLEFVRQSGKK